MTRRIRTRARGFTLAEMLVVIAIIALLAAFLTPALYRVVIRARENRIIQEVNLLHQAAESYKSARGDYFPDFSDSSVVTRHFLKAFNRHGDQAAVTTLTGLNPPLSRAEALVFCLSQTCDDPRQPLSSTTQTPKVFFPFDQARLRPTRTVTLGSRSVQLYTYVTKDGGDAPYVYFDSRTYDNNLLGTGGFTNASVSETVRPYKRLISGAYQYANPTTYQIISAGLDAEFGNTSANKAKRFPDGAADSTNNIEAYTKEDLDNITNFGDGKILKDSME